MISLDRINEFDPVMYRMAVIQNVIITRWHYHGCGYNGNGQLGLGDNNFLREFVSVTLFLTDVLVTKCSLITCGHSFTI